MITSVSNIKNITMIGLMAALITICSWISIPTTVPFTMQTFAVFFAICLLGGKRGFLSVLVWLLLGAMGLPVFSGFTGGIGKFANVTGGYLLGLLLSSLLVWWITHLFGTKLPVLTISMILGLIGCYALGTFWFYALALHSGNTTSVFAILISCVFPFVLPDTIKIFLAISISKTIKKYIFI